ASAAAPSARPPRRSPPGNARLTLPCAPACGPHWNETASSPRKTSGCAASSRKHSATSGPRPAPVRSPPTPDLRIASLFDNDRSPRRPGSQPPGGCVGDTVHDASAQATAMIHSRTQDNHRVGGPQVHPVLGGVVVEGEQLAEVVSDLRDSP